MARRRARHLYPSNSSLTFEFTPLTPLSRLLSSRSVCISLPVVSFESLLSFCRFKLSSGHGASAPAPQLQECPHGVSESLCGCSAQASGKHIVYFAFCDISQLHVSCSSCRFSSVQTAMHDSVSYRPPPHTHCDYWVSTMDALLLPSARSNQYVFSQRFRPHASADLRVNAPEVMLQSSCNGLPDLCHISLSF